jgi:hypothetical protein
MPWVAVSSNVHQVTLHKRRQCQDASQLVPSVTIQSMLVMASVATVLLWQCTSLGHADGPPETSAHAPEAVTAVVSCPSACSYTRHQQRSTRQWNTSRAMAQAVPLLCACCLKREPIHKHGLDQGRRCSRHYTSCASGLAVSDRIACQFNG